MSVVGRLYSLLTLWTDPSEIRGTKTLGSSHVCAIQFSGLSVYIEDAKKGGPYYTDQWRPFSYQYDEPQFEYATDWSESDSEPETYSEGGEPMEKRDAKEARLPRRDAGCSLVEGSLSPTSTPGTGLITTPPNVPPPTSTGYINCTYYGEDLDHDINTAYCVCSGSTFPPLIASSVDDPMSCAYTVMPTDTTVAGVTSSYPVSTDRGDCLICTYVS